jgi:hypothetical protein
MGKQGDLDISLEDFAGRYLGTPTVTWGMALVHPSHWGGAGRELRSYNRPIPLREGREAWQRWGFRCVATC